MALLETLPEEVENSLRELRQQAQNDSNGSTNGDGKTPALPAPSEPTPLSEEESPQKDEDVLNLEEKPIAFATDINAEGVFGPEWLVADNEQVYVFSPNGGKHAHLRHAVPIQRIKEVKAEMGVGNGLLEARTDTETIRLVRFSQAAVAEANTVARQLNALAKGETPKPESLEEKRKHCPRCKRRLPDDSEVCPACVNKRAVMLRLFQFLAPYKWQAIGSVAIILSMTTLELAPPYVGGRIVDTLMRQQARATPSMTPLFELVGILATLRILAAGFQYAQRRLSAWLGARTLMDIRITLYNKFNQLSLGYYDKRSTGSVMARITNDADNLWDFLTDGIPWMLNNTLTLVGIGLILLQMNWQLALLTMTPGPFIYITTRWFMPRARRKWHHVWHRISKMYSALSSTLNGMRVVKAFAQEDREVGRFRDRNRQVFEASYAANSLWATYWPIIGLLMSVGSYIIWLYGGYKVMHHVMTIGTLTAFNGYLWQFYGPFQNFSRVLDWSTRSMTAAERVFEVLDTDPDIQDASQAVPMPEMKGRVEFENVAFTYDKAKRVLDEFNLTVEPGEMIGLVGHSGAGKSTIINLLARFYDVTEGCIKIDGMDIRKIKQDDFRHQFGIVLQEPFLFPGTIRDNIAYAKPDANIEEIMRAAKAANCHEFIMKFPDGYDTQVGERGQRLSGGERQRISIARAILHNPRILILDEATASVDTETEKQIQEAIARLVQNRTTFAIAHRLSTLRHASRLVVMKEGKMAECGTHDELMEQDGVYANLVKIQNEVNKIRAV
ncbi:MAG TPA: ABC transporter transmembrane domain-containing protein [Chthonomonadaceae bacterium]|nr:ABC transporter transmembrane domain-containing protein [Chthonomonadaceae bacterium]